MKNTMIGVDLAKNVFQLHGTSMTGEVKFRKKLVASFFASWRIRLRRWWLWRLAAVRIIGLVSWLRSGTRSS
jgi:hypothetical protein